MSERGISRKDFLRMSVGAMGAVALEKVTVPVKQELERDISGQTGRPVGNAGRESTTTALSIGPQDVIAHAVAPAIVEEPLYRGMPSYMLNKVAGTDTPIRDIFTGSGGLAMTRREAFAGIVSAGIFAALHNQTDKGLDTKKIPLSQFIVGCETWYLQRKCGLPSAIVAHGCNNVGFLQRRG